MAWTTTESSLLVGREVVTALLVVCVSILGILTYFKLRGAVLQKSSWPPGPTPWPIIGSLHLLGAHPHWSLADLARKYGPLMSLQLGQRRCIVATSPEAAKEFLKLQDANFSSRPPLRAAELILPGDVAFHSLTPEVRQLRKILVSELMTPKRLTASSSVRTEEIAYMLKAIWKESTQSADPVIRVRTHLSIMVNNILSRMVLSKRFLGESTSGASTSHADNSEIQEFLAIVQEETTCLGAIHLQDYFNYIPEWFDPQGWNKRSRKLRARMDAFYTNMTNQHKESRRKNPVSDEGEKNLLDVLLEQVVDNHPSDKDHITGVTEKHIDGLIWDTLSAGTETTVVTSEWAMAEVLRSPDVVLQARSELDRVVGRNRIVLESDIPDLDYIRAIVKETLRLHPPLPLLVPHQNTSPTQAFGYDVPADVRLFVNVWAIGRDGKVWEDPLAFKPERFLCGGANGETEFQGQHFDLTPFGAGRRLCPAMAFGSIALHLQVANLLHAFDWSFPGGVEPESLDMTEAPPGLTLSKRDTLVAVAKPRLPAHLY